MKYWTNECYNMYCYFRDDEEYFLYKKQIDEYRDYEKNNIPEWYRNFRLHDSHIVNAEFLEHKLFLTIEHDMSKHPKYQVCFYNYEVIENCDVIDSWIIVDELYLGQENNEFHLLLDSPVDDDYNRAYFTVKFKKMEMIFNNLVCSLGDGVDETLNPKSTSEIYRALKEDSEYYKNSSLYGSKIINIENAKDCLTITLTSFSNNIEYKILMYNYKIVKYGNLVNTVILSNELYIKNNENKLHFFVMNKTENASGVEEFEIKFKIIKFNSTNMLYQAGDGIDESLNPGLTEIATSFFFGNK